MSKFYILGTVIYHCYQNRDASVSMHALCLENTMALTPKHPGVHIKCHLLCENYFNSNFVPLSSSYQHNRRNLLPHCVLFNLLEKYLAH